MTTKKVPSTLEDFFQEYSSSWIEKDCMPSITKLKERAWSVLPVVDVMNVMEAEWLSNAISELGLTDVIGCSFEYNKKATLSVVEVNQDSLLSYSSSHSYEYIYLTSLDERFLYFKDNSNRFFLICGEETFIKRAYGCSFKTSKRMYFDEVDDENFYSAEEAKFLKEVWSKYVFNDLD